MNLIINLRTYSRELILNFKQNKQSVFSISSHQLLFEVEWVRGSVWGGMKNVVASEVAGQTRWPWDGARSTAGLVLKIFLLNYFILITEFSRFLIVQIQ